MPSALYDAHPLWRIPRIWTVIDIEVVSQHASAGTGADDDPSSRRRPSHSSSRSSRRRPSHSSSRTLGQIPAVVARSATALRARPQTDVRSAWSSAVQNPANQTLTVRLPRQRLQNLRPEPGRAQRRVVHRDGSAAMSDNAAVTRALNAARARTCFDPSVRSPDRLGSRAPLQAHFWIGKDSASHRQGEAPEMKAPSTGREKRRGGTRADVRHLPKCMKCNHEIGPGEAYEADAHGQLKVWHAVRLYFDECAVAIPKTLQKMGFCR